MPRWPERQAIGDPNDPRGFEVLFARYLEWRDVHNYSRRARGSCESCLRGFALWCAERGLERPADVSREVMERYQRWLYHYRKERRQSSGGADPDGSTLLFAWLLQMAGPGAVPTLQPGSRHPDAPGAGAAPGGWFLDRRGGGHPRHTGSHDRSRS